MSKAPLVVLEGKLGKFGQVRSTKVAGTGYLTKTKGHMMLHAAVTASQAARLEEAARKVPAEEEAHTRGRAGIGAADVYQRGDSYYIPNIPNTRSQPIEIMRDGRQTTAGASYFSALQDKGTDDDKATATRALGAEAPLVPAHMPSRAGAAANRRQAESDAAMPARPATEADLMSLEIMIEAEDPFIMRQLSANRGKASVVLRLKVGGRVELIRVTQEQIREIEMRPEVIERGGGKGGGKGREPLPTPVGAPRALGPRT